MHGPEDRRPQVVYLHPAKQRVGFPFHRHNVAPFPVMPAGVPGLVNLLRAEGLEVRGLNYPVECLIDPTFKLESWLRNIGRPRVVLIDLHWYEHSYGALDIARVCKKAIPDVRVVLGGMTASLFAGEILESYPYVDFVVRGDAEEPLRQLVLAICEEDAHPGLLGKVPNLSYVADAHVIENGMGYTATSRHLDRLNSVDFDFLCHAREYLSFLFLGTRPSQSSDRESRRLGYWLTTGRGCVSNCSFCGGGRDSHDAIANRSGLTMRSVAAVVDDLEALASRGVHQVSLTLDPEIAGREYWKSLFEEINHRHIRVGLYNESFQLPSADFVEAFAGCADVRHSAIAVTVISGDEAVRRAHGKTFSNHELFARLRTLKRFRVPLLIFYSFNLPGQDVSTMRKSIFLADRIGALYPAPLLAVLNQPHTVDPCSPMTRDPERFDIDVSLRSFNDYFDYCRHTAAGMPGVFGFEGRGFIWRGRTREAQLRMQQLWVGFCRNKRFTCA